MDLVKTPKTSYADWWVCEYGKGTTGWGEQEVKIVTCVVWMVGWIMLVTTGRDELIDRYPVLERWIDRFLRRSFIFVTMGCISFGELIHCPLDTKAFKRWRWATLERPTSRFPTMLWVHQAKRPRYPHDRKFRTIQKASLWQPRVSLLLISEPGLNTRIALSKRTSLNLGIEHAYLPPWKEHACLHVAFPTYMQY